MSWVRHWSTSDAERIVARYAEDATVATKKPLTDRGTYLRVYRKQLDGAWKVLLDMRTSSLTASSPLLGQ